MSRLIRADREFIRELDRRYPGVVTSKKTRMFLEDKRRDEELRHKFKKTIKDIELRFL